MIYYPSDKHPVVAAIDPQTLDNASATSDWVDMGIHGQVMFIENVGATDITVDIKVQSADDTAGTNATDITNLAVTQIAATDDNTQYILCVREDQLNTGDVAAAVVVTAGDGTVGAVVSAVGLGFNTNYAPASDYDIASVDEIVTL